MQNFVQPGEKITYSNSGSAIAAGDVVIIGSLAGVAMGDIAATTGEGEVLLEGVVSLTKTTPLAIAQGDELFWSTGTSKVTKTATDKPLGTAHAAAGSSATSVDVKLYGRGNGIPVAGTVAALTDNSGGATADGTIGAITTGTPADLAAQAAINTQIRDAVKEVATTLNATIASLKAAGLMA
jgi:predicted RecA/RadA family phage recombinase